MKRGSPYGSTTASRVKTLVFHVQSHYGRSEADALLLQTRLDRDYIANETRQIPLDLWHKALVQFTSRWGREEIERTTEATIHPENLGVWTRVLRGADKPGDAFQQLSHYGGDAGRTEHWHTDATGELFWRGWISLRPGMAHESDGLCNLARLAELRAVPRLFGLAPGTARLVEVSGEVLRVEVRWRHSVRQAPSIAAALGGVSAVPAALAWGNSLAAGAAVVAGAAAAGATAGLVWVQEQRRRAQSKAQWIRIQALERASALRDSRESGTAGFDVGALIAGKYRLREKLGAGASGSIWEAEVLADGHFVAIKLLRGAIAHDSVAADRLKREAAALGLAWHPNVVEVFDEGQLQDGGSYLVMERLYGESLAARLKRDSWLAPDLLSPIALQVCDALEAVHAAGIVHRDLKPSNIFLACSSGETNPDKFKVKILDFGIARVEWAETRLTNMDSRVGTPGYMAPEQEQGQEIDSRADIFALGCVIYECLVGTPPPNQRHEFWKLPGSGIPQSGVQRAAQTIGNDWRSIIERATAPLARDRYRDARTFKKALLELDTPSGRSDTAQ